MKFTIKAHTHTKIFAISGLESAFELVDSSADLSADSDQTCTILRNIGDAVQGGHYSLGSSLQTKREA